MARPGLGTRCVQAGYSPKNGEPRQIPIIQSTTFKYESSAEMGKLFDLEASGYFYSRLQNPTNDAVAARIAALEGGTAAMLTGSGMSAIFFSIFNIVGAGDHLVSSSSIYGGSFNLFSVTMKRMGVEVTFVDPDCSPEELDAAFRPNTKAMYGETIANPALTVLDIEKFAAAAHRHGVPLILDNTFATPINCRPFEWGADIVVHSTTKYMDGHAGALGGAIVDSGRFDWTKSRQIPRPVHSRRELPRRDLYRALRSCRCIHHKGHRAADARSWRRAVAAERVLSEPRAGKPARADAAPL